MGPQARFIQTPVQSGSGSLCLYYLWLWTGLAKDFKSFLDAGEQLRLFSGNWCGHIRAENKSGISSISPWGPWCIATLLMALIRWLRYPQKWIKVELTFALASETGKIAKEKDLEQKCFIIASMLIAWSVLGKVHLFTTWETAYNFLKALVVFMPLLLLSPCYSVWPKTESVWRKVLLNETTFPEDRLGSNRIYRFVSVLHQTYYSSFSLQGLIFAEGLTSVS